MHCTWFNENKNKKSSFPPYTFLWVFPLLTHPTSPVPSSPFARLSPPGPRHLLPGPSWPAASDLARAAPADPAPSRGPRCPRPRLSSTEGAHAAGRAGPPSAPLSALTLFSQPN